MSRTVDILIPTYRRDAALAVALGGLAAQRFEDFDVIVSDQSPPPGAEASNEVRAMIRILRALGRPIRVVKHQRRRGMAEQRAFLLRRARARYALFLDDDVWLEPDLIERMVDLIKREECGFVGSAPIGLSYARDRRPSAQRIELWNEPVHPEEIQPGGPGWERHQLHSAANLWHTQRRLRLDRRSRAYRVAWIGGCVLYDVPALRAVGGFEFWRDLPDEHAGEDALAQLRLLRTRGGCGIVPSGAYHLELPTTVPERDVDAPWALRKWALQS